MHPGFKRPMTGVYDGAETERGEKLGPLHFPMNMILILFGRRESLDTNSEYASCHPSLLSEPATSCALCFTCGGKVVVLLLSALGCRSI